MFVLHFIFAKVLFWSNLAMFLHYIHTLNFYLPNLLVSFGFLCGVILEYVLPYFACPWGKSLAACHLIFPCLLGLFVIIIFYVYHFINLVIFIFYFLLSYVLCILFYVSLCIFVYFNHASSFYFSLCGYTYKSFSFFRCLIIQVHFICICVVIHTSHFLYFMCLVIHVHSIVLVWLYIHVHLYPYTLYTTSIPYPKCILYIIIIIYKSMSINYIYKKMSIVHHIHIHHTFGSQNTYSHACM